MTALQLDAQIQIVGPNQSNVVAVLPGKEHRRSLLLNAHLDTVGVDGMDEPFTLKRNGDKLYGRGTYDMKGSVAIMLLLAEYFTRNPPPLDILLTLVSDEEDKSTGMEYLVQKWLPQVSPAPVGGIFLEPTEEDIGVCHKGFTWYELTVAGKPPMEAVPNRALTLFYRYGQRWMNSAASRTSFKTAVRIPCWAILPFTAVLLKADPSSV